MRRRWLLAFWSVAVVRSGAAAEGPPTYERDARPVLAKRCALCHSAKTLDNPDVSAGLALDSYDAVMKGVGGRAVVVPGNATASPLVARLTEADEEKRMPLFDKPLSDAERAILSEWVGAGAPRGEPVSASAEGAAAESRSPRRPPRALDVSIPLNVNAPAGVDGFTSSGPARLVMKVGPLPPVTALAFRPDGRLLAVGAHGTVTVWGLDEGRPAAVLKDLPGPVHALEFSRDGKLLAVGTGRPARSGTARVYAVPGGTLVHEFEGHSDVVFGLAFRPDGTQLATASFDQSVRLWNLTDGRPAGSFRGHSDFVYDVAYDRDGKSVVSASKDRSVKRSSVAAQKELRTYSGHDDDVLAVAVSPEGGRFVSAGHEPQLRWWESDGEKPFKTVGGHSGAVHQLAFSADGRRLISAGGDGTVRLWDGKTGNAQKSLPEAGPWPYAAALSADARLAAAGGWDGLARVWDADSGKLLAVLAQPPAPPESAEVVDWLAVEPGGRASASAGLLPLLRWRIGDAEAPAEAARAAFLDAEAPGRSLRGEPSPPLFK